jgi:hypothetical protein
VRCQHHPRSGTAHPADTTHHRDPVTGPPR